jgi:hypothetical protein
LWLGTDCTLATVPIALSSAHVIFGDIGKPDNNQHSLIDHQNWNSQQPDLAQFDDIGGTLMDSIKGMVLFSVLF